MTGKGSRREREAVQLYQRAGMATYRPATVKFGENDIAGLFDLLAFSPSHSSVHAVQVKSNRAVGIRKWTRHTALFRRLGWRTFYAVPIDNEGWRLIEISRKGTGYKKQGTECPSTVSVKLDPVDERELDCDMGDGIVEYLRGERA